MQIEILGHTLTFGQKSLELFELLDLVNKMKQADQTSIGNKFISLYRTRNDENLKMLKDINEGLTLKSSEDRDRILKLGHQYVSDNKPNLRKAADLVNAKIAMLPDEEQQKIRVLISWWAGNVKLNREAALELVIRYDNLLNGSDRWKLTKLALQLAGTK